MLSSRDTIDGGHLWRLYMETISAVINGENERKAQAMVTSCTYPAYRRQEQIVETNCRRLTRQTNPPEIRVQKMKGMLHLW
jgi:hypothetical protein